jgi:CRISPR/Cas system CSM-associated protein Csm3 (group 7 of RAMP superfamily)
LDAVVDRERIPATSLKGVMRAAAVEVLGLAPAVVERIFGGPGAASPWAWSDIELPGDDDAVVRSRVRIPINPETGVAADGGLFLAEEMWVRSELGFTVDLFGEADDPSGDATLLAAAAMAVKGLGASRRRGLGWVTMTPTLDGRAVPPAEAASAVTAARGASE